MTTQKARPELGDLKPGQKVMVRRSPNDMRRRPDSDRYIPAVVVKASRVWVDLARSDLSGNQLGHRTWRMRRDTQDEGTQYSGSNDSFTTMDQHEWDETQHWARGVLRENGIDLRIGSPWNGREVELADLITKGGRS